MQEKGSSYSIVIHLDSRVANSQGSLKAICDGGAINVEGRSAMNATAASPYSLAPLAPLNPRFSVAIPPYPVSSPYFNSPGTFAGWKWLSWKGKTALPVGASHAPLSTAADMTYKQLQDAVTKA